MKAISFRIVIIEKPLKTIMLLFTLVILQILLGKKKLVLKYKQKIVFNS